jgi:hypothetical protein
VEVAPEQATTGASDPSTRIKVDHIEIAFTVAAGKRLIRYEVYYDLG